MTSWRLVERDMRDALGEGTLWSARDNALYWTDILAPAINRLDLANGQIDRWTMPETVGWLVERAAGGFVAGFKSGFALLDLDPVAIQLIGDPEPDLPNSRMNDGKADVDGNIWCGTMDFDGANEAGSLWRMTPDRKWTRMDSGYGVTNGPAFSADGRWLFHTDTVKGLVYRFRRTATGIADREIFVDFAQYEGSPDGMTVDADGFLWVAHWGGSCISRFSPDGILDRSIALPARQVTNLAFCGGGLDRLFVSTAHTGLDATPFDGALFEVDTGGLRGVEPGVFAG